MKIKVGQLEFAYDTFGNPKHPPMVLIMGFATQRIGWPDAFCDSLAGRGLYVVRVDNRDVGESSRFDSGPVPNVMAALAGDLSSVSYSLDDMADDVVGVIEALGFGSAHVVGASMGGMLGQLIAIRHPRRARSLTSLMSTTGNPLVGQARPDILPIIMTPAPADRDGFIEHRVRIARAIASPGFPFDEGKVRELAARTFERGFDPRGVQRQLLAVMSARDRTPELTRVTTPTLVIHGTDDPVVHLSGGEATARAIPGARFLPIRGMGHDLPRGAWYVMTSAIAENAFSAERRR